MSCRGCERRRDYFHRSAARLSCIARSMQENRPAFVRNGSRPAARVGRESGTGRRARGTAVPVSGGTAGGGGGGTAGGGEPRVNQEPALRGGGGQSLIFLRSAAARFSLPQKKALPESPELVVSGRSKRFREESCIFALKAPKARFWRICGRQAERAEGVLPMSELSHEGFLLCPHCEGDYTHHDRVTVYARVEDALPGRHVIEIPDENTTRPM